MASEEQNKLKLEEIRLQKEFTAAKKEYLESLTIEAELLKEKGELEQNEIDYFSEVKAKMEAATNALEEYNKKLEDQKKKEEELKKKKQEAKDISEQLVTSVAALANIQSEYDETLLGTIESLGKNVNAMGALQKQIAKTFSTMNALGSAFDYALKASVELTLAQDDAVAAFAKAGGNVDRYGLDLINLEQAMFHAGVSMDEAGESVLSLQSNFVNLRNETPATQTKLMKTTAIMNELGVAADITTENINTMTQAFGFSALEAASTQRELFLLARTIDMPPEAMAQAFGDAMPKLAAFGKESTTVFKELQVNARNAGMEVSEVLSIVEQFDTFDGAAKAVGRLNAILGGPFLNSLEMVTVTDPTERMRMLSAAVNDAGLSFDQMDYYQRKALASAMGIDEMQLALMMRDGFDAATPAVKKTQAELLAMAEEAKKTQTLMDELAQTGRMLATTFLPLVRGFKEFLNFVQLANEYFPTTIRLLPKVVLGIGALTTAIRIMKATAIGKGKAGLVSALIGIVTLLVSLADICPTLTPLFYGLAGGVAAIGVAMLAANVASMGVIPGLVLIASTVATLIATFMDLAGVFWVKTHSPGLIDMLGIAGKAFKSFGEMIQFPIKMIGALISKIMDLASQLTPSKMAGLGFLMFGPVGAAAGYAVGKVMQSKDGGASTAGNRITDAKSGDATPSEVSSGGKQQTDVNVTVKADEGDLIRLIIKTIEETQSFRAAGVPPKSNVIKSRVA